MDYEKIFHNVTFEAIKEEQKAILYNNYRYSGNLYGISLVGYTVEKYTAGDNVALAVLYNGNLTGQMIGFDCEADCRKWIKTITGKDAFYNDVAGLNRLLTALGVCPLPF